MSRLSQRQACAQWGVARITLQRAIKEGKVSKDGDGKVDTSEMLRVFGEPKGVAQSQPVEPGKTTNPIRETIDLAIANGRLQAENEALRAIVSMKDETIAAKDATITALQLLTHDSAPAKRRWWQF
jgi:hypothetical protein